jgi:hypothetical protein
MQGPKPIPTAVKELRGNPGHRPLGDREPQPKVGEPPVARAVSDDQLSREILKTLAVRLKGRTRAAPVPGG